MASDVEACNETTRSGRTSKKTLKAKAQEAVSATAKIIKKVLKRKKPGNAPKNRFTSPTPSDASSDLSVSKIQPPRQKRRVQIVEVPDEDAPASPKDNNKESVGESSEAELGKFCFYILWSVN